MNLFLQVAPASDLAMAGALTGFFAVIAAFLIAFLIIGVLLYVYFALVLMKLAKKTGTEPAWLAWIPIANIYLMSKMAGMHWWPMLLLIPSFIASLHTSIAVISILANFVLLIFVIIWWWKILVKVGKPGWWVLLNLIPGIGPIIFMVLIGVAAFGKSGGMESGEIMKEPVVTPV